MIAYLRGRLVNQSPFDPLFYETDSVADGTGLHTMRARVQALNGKIDIATEIGEGVALT